EPALPRVEKNRSRKRDNTWTARSGNHPPVPDVAPLAKRLPSLEISSILPGKFPGTSSPGTAVQRPPPADVCLERNRSKGNARYGARSEPAPGATLFESRVEVQACPRAVDTSRSRRDCGTPPPEYLPN